jgi:hypothetical protein
MRADPGTAIHVFALMMCKPLLVFSLACTFIAGAMLPVPRAENAAERSAAELMDVLMWNRDRIVQIVRPHLAMQAP